MCVGELDLTSSPPDKDSGERYRADGPSCLKFLQKPYVIKG